MHKTLIALLFLILSNNLLYSQTVTEKEIFTLAYNGSADPYSFIYDDKTGQYSYLYYIEGEKNCFLICNDFVSEKYEYINIFETRTDSKGNRYTVAGNYALNYGTDNNFLLLNGKEVLNFEYIESYSSFINKDDEYVFVYKKLGDFYIGRYSPDKGLSSSVGYELVRTVYKDTINYNKEEGDAERSPVDYFYKDDNGERCFIAVKDGKVNLVFETKEIKTNYTDINDASLTVNRNNELSYIAKKKGRFYESTGNELVVSGNKEYKTFPAVYPPVRFKSNNEPVYYASDSLGENNYDFYVVTGNERQKIRERNSDSKKKIRFGLGISDLRINDNGDITYLGLDELMIPAVKKYQDEEVYDEYLTKTYFVNNGNATELGYNLGLIKFTKDGNLLYSGIENAKKKKYMLIESNGISKIILSDKNKFDQIVDYGYTPFGEIYYAGQNYEVPEKNKKSESSLYIGNRLIGKYDYFLWQSTGSNSSVIKFDSKNNFAFVTESPLDSMSYYDRIYLNGEPLPFPETVTNGDKRFSMISGLMFSGNGKLFYIGDIKTEPYKTSKEVFIDNRSTGNVYESAGEISYDPSDDKLTFYASREKKLFLVTVKF